MDRLFRVTGSFSRRRSKHIILSSIIVGSLTGFFLVSQHPTWSLIVQSLRWLGWCLPRLGLLWQSRLSQATWPEGASSHGVVSLWMLTFFFATKLILFPTSIQRCRRHQQCFNSDRVPRSARRFAILFLTSPVWPRTQRMWSLSPCRGYIVIAANPRPWRHTVQWMKCRWVVAPEPNVHSSYSNRRCWNDRDHGMPIRLASCLSLSLVFSFVRKQL